MVLGLAALTQETVAVTVVMVVASNNFKQVAEVEELEDIVAMAALVLRWLRWLLQTVLADQGAVAVAVEKVKAINTPKAVAVAEALVYWGKELAAAVELPLEVLADLQMVVAEVAEVLLETPVVI